MVWRTRQSIDSEAQVLIEEQQKQRGSQLKPNKPNWKMRLTLLSGGPEGGWGCSEHILISPGKLRV